MTSTRKRRDSSPRSIKIDERRLKVLSYRRQGASWVKIAQLIKAAGAKGDLTVPPKYDDWSAQRDFYSAIERWGGHEDADVARALELIRLDEIFTGVFPLAKRSDLFAVDRFLAIMDRRAKLIPGLYPKESINVNVEGKVGVGGVTEEGQVAGPVVVRIEWPDVPNDNEIGFADVTDPATVLEVRKALIGMLGLRVGSEIGDHVALLIAKIAERDHLELSTIATIDARAMEVPDARPALPTI